MINEKVFSAHFSEFWRSNLPNLEAVVRSTNIAYIRVTAPFEPRTNPYRRDLISEGGYRFFLKLLGGVPVDREGLRAEAVAEAQRYLSANFAHGGEPIDSATSDETQEIERLVRWLASYFADLGATDWKRRLKRPAFKGHGLIGPCTGDFELDGALVEMKYVDRGFRSQDLRQLITYAGLKYFESGSTFDKLILINPLHGVAFATDPREIVYSASGTEVFEFFQALSYALSSGEVSH
jgi:hypothetical protein